MGRGGTGRPHAKTKPRAQLRTTSGKKGGACVYLVALVLEQVEFLAQANVVLVERRPGLLEVPLLHVSGGLAGQPRHALDRLVVLQGSSPCRLIVLSAGRTGGFA